MSTSHLAPSGELQNPNGIGLGLYHYRSMLIPNALSKPTMIYPVADPGCGERGAPIHPSQACGEACGGWVTQ